MSWSGIIWHFTTPRSLATGAAEFATKVRDLHPAFHLRLFQRGSGFAPGLPKLTRDPTASALRESLRSEHSCGLFSGNSYDGPDLELSYITRTFENPRMDYPCFDPELRELPWIRWGAVLFNVHANHVTINEVRRAFRLLLECTPDIAYAELHSTALTDHLRDLNLPPRAASRIGPARGPALVQAFGPSLEQQTGLDTLLTNAELGASSFSRCSGFLLLELCESGDFDADNPTHRRAIQRLYQLAPGLFPAEEEQPPRFAATLYGPDSVTVLGPAIGRRLLSAGVLQHARDGTPVEPGQGPVELRFSDGLTLHSWPIAGGTRWCAGPLPEHQASWSLPGNTTDSLRLVTLRGDPVRTDPGSSGRWSLPRPRPRPPRRPGMGARVLRRDQSAGGQRHLRIPSPPQS